MPAPKELTLDDKIAILREYLVYDLRNVRNMVSFVHEYPSVLTDPQIAESIVPDPACYHTAVVMGYWPSLLAAYPVPSSLSKVWLDKKHIAALANEDVTLPSLDEFLELMDAYAVEGLYTHRHGFPDDYYLAREAMRLATRMSRDAAPMVCGMLDLILPTEELQEFVQVWGDAGAARYAWCRHRSELPWSNHFSPLKSELALHDAAIRQWPQDADAIHMLETSTALHDDDPFEGSMALARTLMGAGQATSPPLVYPDIPPP